MASRFPRMQRASSAMRPPRHLPPTAFSLFMPRRKTAPPAVSNLNFQSGDMARANFCVVLMNGGEIIIYTTATTHVVFDVTGYVL
jgi:hypothetical protein